MPLTKSQLKSVIKYQLKGFNRDKVDISDDTQIIDVLAHNFNNAQRLFKANVLWSVRNATGENKKFPLNWLNDTVSSLAGKLVILLLFVLSGFTSQAQVKINAGTVRTDAKNVAVNILFQYAAEMDSLYGGSDQMIYGKKSYVIVTPDINFYTGTADAFSTITAKAVGLWTHFRTTQVDGVTTPDISKTLHVIPISAGVETNNRFDFINALVEVGYQPYYQSETANVSEFVIHTKFGIYLQGGYKFDLDSAAGVPFGGAVDESEEQIDSKLFRAKATFGIDTHQVINLGGFKMGVMGNTTLWRDFVNNEWYYQVQGVGRVYLTDRISFDLNYMKGSGAPNFNEGSQFGTGLTIVF